MNDIITPIATLIGVVVGGGIGFFTNYTIKKQELAHSDKKDEISLKRKLYSDFLGEANKLIIESIIEKKSDSIIFSNLANLLAQIELMSDNNVYNAAKKLFSHVLSPQTEMAVNSEGYSDIRNEFVILVKEEFRVINIKK